MTRGSLRQRIKRLVATIRPAHSLAARVQGLTEEQRAIYDRWRVAMGEWIDLHETTLGGAYEALINDVPMPALPNHVADILFGKPPTLSASATVEQAVEAYRRVLGRE